MGEISLVSDAVSCVKVTFSPLFFLDCWEVQPDDPDLDK